MSHSPANNSALTEPLVNRAAWSFDSSSNMPFGGGRKVFDRRVAMYVCGGQAQVAEALCHLPWFAVSIRQLGNISLLFAVSEPGALAAMTFTTKGALTISHASLSSSCTALLDWLPRWSMTVCWLTYWRYIAIGLMVMDFGQLRPNFPETPTWMMLPLYFGFPVLMLILALQAMWLVEAVPDECRASDPGLVGYAETVSRSAAFVFLLSLAAGTFAMTFKYRARHARQLLEGIEGPAAAVITAQLAAGGLPTEEELQGTECAICLGSGEPPEEWRRCGCGHIFHLHCMQEWLTLAQHCPLCRFDLRRACLDAGGVLDME